MSLLQACLPHNTVQQTLRRLLKWLGYIALGCYVFLAVVVLGVRYWVLPNIDQWRGPLERQLSAMLSVQAQIGAVEAEWRGRHPSVRLADTVLRDTDGSLLLNIPSLNATVAWSSLFSAAPRFLALRTEGVELTLRRDQHDRISLVGYEFEGREKSEDASQENSGVLEWLAQQGNVQFVNASVTWLDDLRAAPPLKLRDVSLGLGTAGNHHSFSIRARPPTGLGASFVLQGRVNRVAQAVQALSSNSVNGLFHISIDDMHPAGWAPWLDVHDVMERGRVSWQGWQEVVNGVPLQHVSQVTVLDGVWRLADGVSVEADSAQVYLAGPLQAMQRIFPTQASQRQLNDPDVDRLKIRAAVRIGGLTLNITDQFETPLQFDEIAVSADVGSEALSGLRLEFDQAQLRNADMDLALQGSWSQYGAGSAGLVDVQGRFHRAELAAIVRYLPRIVNNDARDWLRYGLLEGRLLDAPVRVQGDLARFPFGDNPAQGDFSVGGRVQDAVIDYAPASEVGPPGWPRLEKLNGHAQLHRVDLTIRADTVQMQPGGQTIALHDVDARIQNIEHDSVLEVAGVGRAEAAAFLALLKETPLARMLDGLFDEAGGAGRWEVPISLSIPLMDVDATRVRGDVVFNEADLWLDDVFPALSHLTGALAFTEEHINAQTLKARALGGPVTISGGVGKEQKGLQFDGSLTAKALNAYLDGKVAGLLEGVAPYRLTLSRTDKGAFGMRLASTLEGLSILLPEPLSKPAAQRWPLQAAWTPRGKDSASLDIRLSDQLEASFLRRNGVPRNKSFFHAGAVSLKGKANPPGEGLVLDIRTPRIDIDAWRDAAGFLDGRGQGESTGRAIFPSLRDLRVQADQASVLGTTLDHLTFTARRPDAGRWRVDVSSTQTAGTLFWREQRGRIEGEVKAHFERLALGAEPDGNAEQSVRTFAVKEDDQTFLLNDDIDFPAIHLKVDRLRVYGRDLGALALVGLNEKQGRSWKLEQLELSSPHASLKGSGLWRLHGPQRGLTLQFKAMFDDLGAYLTHAGFKDLMDAGQGQVEGRIEWRDLPWKFSVSGLQGNLSIDLGKGRFSSVGSRSARLLELLSLQSVQRLASLNWNPGGLMQQGFPFDALHGDIKVTNGVLHSENYRVTGPVATIIIAGDVDLSQEALDLNALVVPNLDVSGAAIAAGIVVNPIVGVGAFLTQWLLKDPMSKAMSVEYRVKGRFDSPDIDTVSASE